MPPGPVRRTIAVFGSSEPLPGEALYAQALELGRLLARSGCRVLTGGYGGVMEAASRGATEAGGEAVGVTCTLFADRRPNPFLTRRVSTDGLPQRTAVLVGAADGFVVLAGKAGTLAELAQLWALQRAGCLVDRPVILLGRPWETVVRELTRAGVLEAAQRRATTLVDSPAAALRALGPTEEPPA